MLMGDTLQILLFVIVGIILLWVGYSLFFGKASPFYPGLGLWKKKKYSGRPGDPMTCPICSAKLIKGDLVKTIAFPTAQSLDRLMYIRGCPICLDGNIPRKCPVCRAKMSTEDYLISRMFERIGRKNHIHVIGCNYCKKLGTWAK